MSFGGFGGFGGFGDEVALALAGIAGFGLPGPRPPGLGSTDPPWAELLAAVGRHRMEGLLAAAVGAGALAVDPGRREDVRQVARGRAATDLLLEREVLDIAACLAGAGVGYRVLKGPAWAHGCYPDPSWRGFGDVDLLIGPDQWEQAIDALERRGALRAIPELRPGFDRRFGKEATLVSARGWELDLHRTLVVGPYGLWVDLDDLWGRDATVTICGVELPALDPEASFLHACYNAALADDPPRLLAVRDVLQWASVPNLDIDAVATLAARWRGRAVVAAALGLAGELGPLPGSLAALARHRPGRRSSLLMAAYRGPARGYTSQLAGVVALRGAGARLAYLRALARPQAAYRQARGSSASRLRPLAMGVIGPRRKPRRR